MLVVRQFEDDDFESLCIAFDQQWGWELGDDFELRHNLAVHYLSAALVGANVIRVAQFDGKTVGVMCAQAPQPSQLLCKHEIDKARYMSLCELSGQKLRACELGRKAIAFYATIDAANATLETKMKKTGLLWDAEMTLLLCSEDARGKGVGKGLVAALFSELKSRSAHWCMLKTDSHCNWRFYERQHWELVASADWPDQSGIVGFAFRKAVTGKENPS